MSALYRYLGAKIRDQVIRTDFLINHQDPALRLTIQFFMSMIDVEHEKTLTTAYCHKHISTSVGPLRTKNILRCILQTLYIIKFNS